ncbi:MAG TPA: RtcB family protein, partial [Candidatus Binatia bacterium]|nr:RtcB family protein [Candidatus Binatia bacterium]
MAADFEKISPFHWRLGRDARRGMKADAEIFASESILRQAEADGSIEQVLNVACLPGLAGNSLAMPDIHYGYGFCIGAVAAFPADNGIVLPGGVGYDINCGVRLLASSIPVQEFAVVADPVGHAILQRVPTGLTPRGIQPLNKKDFQRVVSNGVKEIVRRFGGDAQDSEFIESNGCRPFDAPGALGPRACERGAAQLGSLGSGNHVIEI